MISLLRRYWFSACMSIFLLGAFLYFIIVFTSPRYDIQRRGFVPCTEKLAIDIENCGKNNILCILGSIGKDNICNIQVIGHGMSAWLQGEQRTPWANYIFEPELPTQPQTTDEGIEEFYQENPNIHQEMQQLKKLNKEQEDE